MVSVIEECIASLKPDYVKTRQAMRDIQHGLC